MSSKESLIHEQISKRVRSKLCNLYASTCVDAAIHYAIDASVTRNTWFKVSNNVSDHLWVSFVGAIDIDIDNHLKNKKYEFIK